MSGHRLDWLLGPALLLALPVLLAGCQSPAVALRLYATMMTLWEQPQPQDDQVVGELPAEAHWDTHAHYLAVRRGRQAFHVQLYTSHPADAQLRVCIALARIILSRLPS